MSIALENLDFEAIARRERSGAQRGWLKPIIALFISAIWVVPFYYLVISIFKNNVEQLDLQSKIDGKGSVFPAGLSGLINLIAGDEIDVRVKADAINSDYNIHRGNFSIARTSMSGIVDATTTTKGKVELATDGENAADVVVQGNDSRLSDARAPKMNWNETPGGVVDGVNAVFTLVSTPSPAGALMLFVNGVLQRAGAGNDFTLSGSTVTFEAGAIPQTGDILLATYGY